MPPPRKTNREVEIKLAVSDLHTTKRAIKALGASFHGRVFEANTLYDTPHADLRSRGRLLRVRTESPAPQTSRSSRNRIRRVVLTSKAPPPSQKRGSKMKSRYKERAEREVAARHTTRSWPAALRRLGLQPSFCYHKYRSSFHLGALHLDLDETPVGTFLELEGRPAAIDRVASALGYTPSAYIRGTYWDLYSADCRRRGREPRNMVFSKK
ncbi:MAG: class IV adenylate cyclase [Candidatus Acidiferrales bacterium]